MKKLVIFMMVAVLAVGATACQGKAVDNGDLVGNESEIVSPEEDVEVEKPEVSLTLEEIIDQMYEKSGLEFPKTMKADLTEENVEYMLGVSTVPFVEGLVSEPMMSSQAHSIVLFTVEDDADIDAIKKDIKENVDGQKWICVGVDDENIVVENVGNYVVLIMDHESAALKAAFMEIME